MKGIALFLNHGGGPCLLWAMLHTRNWGSPKAIVLVTAHWETDIPTITSNPQPDLLFDYYGFPKETYSYRDLWRLLFKLKIYWKKTILRLD
jgi:aromatic ring-opening dioxygenase catalytic subunit (LigB family)